MWTALQVIAFRQCLETYHSRFEQWLQNLRIVIDVSKSTAVLLSKPASLYRRPLQGQISGQPTRRVQKARCLRMTFDTQIMSSAHVSQVRRKAAQRTGMLPCPNCTSTLSIRICVLLYKQCTLPLINHAYSKWSFSTRGLIRKLQSIQSTCLCTANNAPGYDGIRQTDDDLVIAFFVDHIRALSEIFYSKFAEEGTNFSENLKPLMPAMFPWSRLRLVDGDWCLTEQTRLPLILFNMAAESIKWIVSSTIFYPQVLGAFCQ